jgi:hypothetical protein
LFHVYVGQKAIEGAAMPPVTRSKPARETNFFSRDNVVAAE